MPENMGYVMFGRPERLEDLYVTGEMDIKLWNVYQLMACGLFDSSENGSSLQWFNSGSDHTDSWVDRIDYHWGKKICQSNWQKTTPWLM